MENRNKSTSDIYKNIKIDPTLYNNDLFFGVRKVFFKGNQKVKSIIVTEVTVMSPFIMYSSQNPWNFLDMEVIMIKEDVKCLSPFHLKSIRVTLLQ